MDFDQPRGESKPHANSERALSMVIRRELIAVVDSDPHLLNTLASLLWAHGYRTELFASAAEFAARADSCHPACLVLDAGLAGPSAFELGRHAAVAGRRVPVIFTGAEDEGARAKAKAAGAAAYLRKPFRAGDLLGALAQATQTVAAQGKDQLARLTLGSDGSGSSGPAPYVVKRQANRRLLDKARNRYVSRADLRQLVMQRAPLLVLDKDDRDITRETLLQVVIEQERSGHGVLTPTVLAQLIQHRAGARAGLLGEYLEECVRRWSDSQDKAIS